MSDQDNIWTTGPGAGGKKRLPEDKLLAYLEGKLPPAEQHEVEQWLAEEGMESDAIEGLKALPPEETRHSVNRLNRNLHKAVQLKKNRGRRHLKTDQFTWIAIVIVLLIAIIAYIVVRKSM